MGPETGSAQTELVPGSPGKHSGLGSGPHTDLDRPHDPIVVVQLRGINSGSQGDLIPRSIAGEHSQMDPLDENYRRGLAVEPEREPAAVPVKERETVVCPESLEPLMGSPTHRTDAAWAAP